MKSAKLLAEYIRLHYGTCSTMQEKPRRCKCRLAISPSTGAKGLTPEEQVMCPNWTSETAKSWKELYEKRRQ